MVQVEELTCRSDGGGGGGGGLQNCRDGGAGLEVVFKVFEFTLAVMDHHGGSVFTGKDGGVGDGAGAVALLVGRIGVAGNTAGASAPQRRLSCAAGVHESVAGAV